MVTLMLFSSSEPSVFKYALSSSVPSTLRKQLVVWPIPLGSTRSLNMAFTTVLLPLLVLGGKKATTLPCRNKCSTWIWMSWKKQCHSRQYARAQCWHNHAWHTLLLLRFKWSYTIYISLRQNRCVCKDQHFFTCQKRPLSCVGVPTPL